MKIIVTGGAGFIGSHLTRALLDLGHEVIVIDDLSRGRKENVDSRADFYQVSVTDFEAIAPLFIGVTYVYHMAALARVRPSLKQPVEYHKVNVNGTLNVMEACRLAKVRKLIFASSSSIFGNQKLPYSEDTPTQPLNPYALQKLIAEQYIRLYGDLYDFSYVILRFFNVYGPGQILGGAYSTVIGTFIDQHRRGLPLTIFGNGEQRRDFTHIRDVVDGCIRAMGPFRKEEFNLGRGSNRSVNDIADLISDDRVYLAPVPGEARETLCDNTNARHVLKWQPSIDITPEVIQEMVDAYSD